MPDIELAAPGVRYFPPRKPESSKMPFTWDPYGVWGLPSGLGLPVPSVDIIMITAASGFVTIVIACAGRAVYIGK